MGPVGKNVVMAPGSQLSQGTMSCPVISKSLRTQGLERCMINGSVCMPLSFLDRLNRKRQSTAKAFRPG
jgi:hypothetical protein